MAKHKVNFSFLFKGKNKSVKAFKSMRIALWVKRRNWITSKQRKVAADEFITEFISEYGLKSGTHVVNVKI